MPKGDVHKKKEIVQVKTNRRPVRGAFKMGPPQQS